MEKQQDQQLVHMKTMIDSNDDDDDGDSTSTSSISADSDQSTNIANLMRENERKMRRLSESYMNRFLFIGQQAQTLPELSNALALPSTMKSVVQKKSPKMELEIMSSIPSLTLFVESLKQLIQKEEKKREKSYLPPDDKSIASDLYTRLSLGITQCLRDYEGEINHAKRRIHDLNEQQEHILNENKNVVSHLTEAFEKNTISLRQTYEKRLAKQREESLKIGSSLDNYKVEILALRDAYEKKLRVKDELINELNDRLAKNETEQAARQHALHLKIEHFQQSFDTLQARNKQVELNNQIKNKENHDLLTQVSNLQRQIQHLQQTVTSKAHECTELSQKLAATLPKLNECERFGSELQRWFQLVAPENNSSDLTLDDMSTIVSSKVSHFESFKKQLDLINEDLDHAHILEGSNLSDRIRYAINQNKQYETAHSDISNKYQALLLQTNMLTGIIKQHSTEVANHKTIEEQLKEFNEQLLNENQNIKIEMQNSRSKLLQITNTNNQLEHEYNLNKQHSRDLQIKYETIKTESQVLANELQTKREAIKRYEQELQSMKQLFEISLKEKQIQSDQIKHERQLFQTENDTLKQIVIRDGHDKQTISQIQFNSNALQRQYNKSNKDKETVDDEVRRISKSHSQEVIRFVPVNENEDDETTDNRVSRRATSTPTPRENENQQQSNLQSLGITKQINQVLNDMKSLLTHGREVVIKHEEEMIPERDFKVQERNKGRHSKKERTTITDIK
ncbi:unnamed protein product [Rotaria socialis]|uniref:Uncharacterized protein n=1 Tax=Rotaria socialis TaxID=392032 RepID=A0A820TCM0_9BILA|nr:unnamed protein product [Rotaria socialis]CAF4464698.1 unnamed protein product [Rotaria socialis]